METILEVPRKTQERRWKETKFLLSYMLNPKFVTDHYKDIDI